MHVGSDVDRAAGVLAEHVWIDHRVECTCEWEPEGLSRTHGAQHLAHVAAALAAAGLIDGGLAAAVEAWTVEWSSRDTFDRIGNPYPEGQGSPYSAARLLEVGGKPVYRVRTIYRDAVTEWADFTGDEDPGAFYSDDPTAALAAGRGTETQAVET